jgi:hypothetical protein
MGKPITPDMITLVNAEGVIIEHLSMVHICTGPNIGKAYRYEKIVIAGHRTFRVKITRKSIAGHFRSVEWVHPSDIGCDVQIPLTFCERFKLVCVHAWSKIDDWFMAGVIALIPLAVFEHYHLATKITEVVSLGMLSTGGGGH